MSTSESAAPRCDEQVRLLRLLRLRLTHDQRAIEELARFIGKLTKSDYEDLLKLADTASKIVAQVRRRLEPHTAEHGF